MSFSLKPLADRVIVKPREAEEKTKGGIVIPDTAKEKPQEAEVVAVGPGAYDDEGNRKPMNVKVAILCLWQVAGTEVKIDEKYLISASRSY